MTDLSVPLTDRRRELLWWRLMRTDKYPFRDDPRYLDREPEAIRGAKAVADDSETRFFVESPFSEDGIIYVGVEPEEIVHSWMRTFTMNVHRRLVGINHDIRCQRCDDQTGLDEWAGGPA